MPTLHLSIFGTFYKKKTFHLIYQLLWRDCRRMPSPSRPFILTLLLSVMTALAGTSLLAAPVEISAKSFGLDAASPDNTLALRAALAACAKEESSRLVFAPGVYRFDAANFGSDRVLALVENISDFSLEGNGAVFLLVGDPSKVTGLRFSRCRNIAIKNLVVDCEQLPFAQGKIVSFDEGKKLIIELDPKFPLQEGLPIESIVDCDAETGLMLANIDLYKQAIESFKIEGNRLMVQAKLTVDAGNAARLEDLNKLHDVLPGQRALIRQATYGSFMFTFLSSQGILLEDVTVHCFAGMAVHGQESGDITLRRFVAEPPKGSGRLLSITKDCLHFTHAFGKVLIEDSRMDAIGDDGLNVYAKFRTVSKVIDPKNLEMIFPLAGWRCPTPESGEQLNFWDAETMAAKGSAVVESASWDASGKKFKVQFRSPLPDGLEEKDLVNSERYIAKVEVRRTQFRSMLARAMVFSTYDILVEDCEVEATSYSGMLFPAGVPRHGGQAPASRRVVIRNNTFHGTGGAAIYGYLVAKKPVTSSMSDIVIEGNKISSDPALDARRLKTRRPDWLHWSAGLCLLDASNVRITGNSFSGYSTALYLQNLHDLSVLGNASDRPAKAILNSVTGNVSLDANSNFTFERDEKTYDPDLYYIGILR
jgi:hypothetical protein